jgi:hypothetical protein
MKMYKLQTDRFHNPLLKRIIFFSKIAGLLIIFNCAASTFLFARKDHNHDVKKEPDLAIPVMGQVLDENNNPLSGVTIQVKKCISDIHEQDITCSLIINNSITTSAENIKYE